MTASKLAIKPSDDQIIPGLIDPEETIAISVQGTVFVLKTLDIVSFDWMVSRMLTCRIPSTQCNNMIYLDVDSICFRIILSVLQGITDLKFEVSRISTTELALLKSTAEYLLCENIVKEINTFETEFKALTKQQAKYQELLEERNTLISELKTKKKSESLQIIEAMKFLQIKSMECKGKSPFHGGKCPNEFLVIGTDYCTVGGSIVCTKCINENSLKKDGREKYSFSEIKTMNHLAQTMMQISKETVLINKYRFY